MSLTYESAGVSISAGNEAVRMIKEKVKTTFSPHVLTGIGGFGGAFDIKSALSSYNHPILIQSIDGVGTKLSIAKAMNKYDTVGIDVVSNCCNDALAMGAVPITFLDYVAHEKLDHAVMAEIMDGMVKGCRENNVSLIGGETAEMPGTYTAGEHDIVGCVTGVVEKEKIITGKNIQPGDVLLGFSSSGLHTNGYSLARKALFEIGGYSVHSSLPELEKSLGETLLEPHLNYTNPVLKIINAGIEMRGIVHVTGGGFIENIPRILPDNCSVEIKKDSWPILPIFKLIERVGNISEQEMYTAFNMGIGLILVITPEEVLRVRNTLFGQNEFKIYEIGKVVEVKQEVKLI